MILPFRVVSVTMVLALLLGGPLTPMAAGQSQQPQSDVFKETTKGAILQDPPPPKADVEFSETFYDVTAGVMTAFLVPGRAATCLAGGAVGFIVLVFTLGSAYRAAHGALEEGCGGKWIVRGEDLRPDRPPGQPR